MRAATRNISVHLKSISIFSRSSNGSCATIVITYVALCSGRIYHFTCEGNDQCHLYFAIVALLTIVGYNLLTFLSIIQKRINI